MSQTLMLVVGLCSAVVLLATPNDSIKSGVPWFDTDGNLIDAHGAGLLEHEGRFYWYGSVRSMNSTGNDHNGGISLYSSADLYNWKYESVVLPVFNCSSPDTDYSDFGDYPTPSCKNGNGLDLERPKVVQCGGPGGKFVMWVRGTGYGNTPQLLGVLTSDSPTGPFTYVSNTTGSDDPFVTVAPGIKNYPPGYQYADATLFQDPLTRKTYTYWRTRITNGLAGPTGFRGMELTADCHDVVHDSDTQIFHTPDREGPAMFVHDGSFYLWTSGTRGWEPTTMFLYLAASPLGDFANSSNPGHGWHTYSKGTSGNSSSWNQTWLVRDGYVPMGNIWGNQTKRNLTLPAAEALCAGSASCAGFCFIDVDRTPASTKILDVSLKTRLNFVPEPKAAGVYPSPIPNPGDQGNRQPAQPGIWAFDSQSTYILPNPKYKEGSKIAPFIYMGDRWDQKSAYGTTKATYVWLPLFIDSNNPSLVSVVWTDEWKLDDTTLYPFA